MVCSNSIDSFKAKQSSFFASAVEDQAEEASPKFAYQQIKFLEQYLARKSLNLHVQSKAN